MSVYPVMLQMPDYLYEQLQRKAAKTEQSVEEQALTLLAAAVPDDEQLSDALQEAIAALPLLDDKALWAAARSHLPRKLSTQLEELNHKQQREGLTASESERLEQFVLQYERTMLIRAQAAVLLKERGYDISTLLKQQ